MRTFFKLVLIVAILAAGGGIFKWLVDTKPKTEKKPISIGAPLVETISVQPVQRDIKVSAMGTVIPASEVILQPQIQGTVLSASPRFIPGGRFAKGEIMLEIDKRDYEIAFKYKRSELIRAQVELDVERSRQSIAKKEWEYMGSEVKTSKMGEDLALRKPYLKTAEAMVESARSGIEKAELDIKRTKIMAPFNCMVKTKLVSVGQYVAPGFQLGSVVSVDEFWVQISIPVDQLSWISVPGLGNKVGSQIAIIHAMRNGTPRVRRYGRVLRILGDLDPVGRMARILASVNDPLGLQETDGDNRIPLLLGAYVRVEIQGPKVSRVFEIPRKALRDYNRIWLYTPDGKLEIRSVDIVWRQK
ncbi:MAG: HlyD family efflux transporter periplasmic adaptor subunit, partial [Proteobacteria bacterium]|nr:HlyD family efflux transporter periplasmic adaptor subunit [Pseudomonadota bacterium]